jgi:hypothetical protein
MLHVHNRDVGVGYHDKRIIFVIVRGECFEAEGRLSEEHFRILFVPDVAVDGMPEIVDGGVCEEHSKILEEYKVVDIPEVSVELIEVDSVLSVVE